MEKKSNNTLAVAVAGFLLVALLLVVGTMLMGRSAAEGTDSAVRSVSLLYLDELASRREQVVEDRLKDNVSRIGIAVSLMTEDHLRDIGSRQAFQSRMQRLFHPQKFAFVDSEGLIYTALGTQQDIEKYHFDYRSLSEPDISIKDIDSSEKKVIIAVPTEGIRFRDKTLTVCFMEIDMQSMLADVSMNVSQNGVTFSNLYTSDGVALSNKVLGGLASESNLLEAMRNAEFEKGYSLEMMNSDFADLKKGVVSFSYNGVRETLSYVPVTGTDWLLTYLIRESVISDQIGAVSNRIITRSVLQSVLSAFLLAGVFIYIIRKNQQTARLRLEKETSDAEMRGKQVELEQRLALQEQLLAQQREKMQQENLITALASDYWSVYYLDLDRDQGVCYQSHADIDDGFKAGEEFRYLEAVTAYANTYITEKYRDDFLRFIQPDAIRRGLSENRVISYRYMVHRHGKDTYEMVRFAGVRHPEDREGDTVHYVGACFTDVDTQTREALSQSHALSDALAAAEQANKAKTAFLSNMSHEIRTPMNAIIGLDNIAANDPEATPKIRDYLGKIGDSAHHLLDLINDILDMSRIESGRMTLKNEEFSFSKLIEQINTMFSGQCQDKGLDYQCRIKGQIDDYYIGDNMKLRQVLINILGNAVKFTPEGGRVELTAERTANFDDKSTLRFTISDTGIGMSKEYLPHIFDAFSQEDSSATNKYGSSGLGLAITKNIVEMMNGNIQVESEKGKGTTFIVSVTLMDSKRLSDDSEDIFVDPKAMSVLIIDDDPVACDHARLVLEKVGTYAETALSGEEALEMVRLRQARREPYNLILVDWQMPEMDGVETTRRIRDICGSDSAIIILTAYRWDDILEEALEAGVDRFISKPLFISALMEEFREALRKRSTLARQLAAKAQLEGRRILLAEDVQVNAEIMKMVLAARQIDVDLAENGRIAVEKFADSPEGCYDAVLMDMRMPEMDGLEATRHIRAMERSDAKTVPIIALTANAFDEDVQRSLQAGLNAHLSKPVEPEMLYATLESLIKP